MTRIGIFVHHLVRVVDEVCLPVIQLVGLFPDIGEVPCRYRSTAQETHRLTITWLSIRPQALGFRMHSIFREPISISLHPGHPFAPSMARYGDVDFPARVAVNPRYFEPLPGIGIPRRDQVETFGVGVLRQSKRIRYEGGQKEVERLDAVGVGFPLVHTLEEME